MEKILPKSILIAKSIFIVCLILSAVLVFNTYIKIFPFSQSWTYIILLPLFAICINLGLGLLRYYTDFLKKGLIFYLFQWIMTIILPILFISLMELAVQKILMRNVISKMSPIVNYIDNYKVKNNTLPVKIKKNISNIDNFTYYHNNKDYMIKTLVSAIDKKGETIFFNSKDKTWYRFNKNQYDYFKDKKIAPPNIKTYLWFEKNTKITDRYKK